MYVIPTDVCNLSSRAAFGLQTSVLLKCSPILINTLEFCLYIQEIYFSGRCLRRTAIPYVHFKKKKSIVHHFAILIWGRERDVLRNRTEQTTRDRRSYRSIFLSCFENTPNHVTYTDTTFTALILQRFSL